MFSHMRMASGLGAGRKDAGGPKAWREPSAPWPAGPSERGQAGQQLVDLASESELIGNRG